MKRLISAFLAVMCVLALTLSFTSCASMDEIEDNIRSGSYNYSKATDEDDMEYYLDDYGVDVDDYGIKKVIKATHTYRYSRYVIVVECKSFIAANRLAKEIKDIANEDYDADVEIKGKCVLIGNKVAIDDALGK